MKSETSIIGRWS